ncbi:F0F1 ATP synthase subunit B [Frigidibacter sp. ROC022]|uniref:F0F1 ATP synthase subunit B n=1 Tax=Frigidibacter sp. ROC022 TaxID=2971796 RepID=UPI00215A2AC4|nr:F0F1 ATP synthase subunit B [Frigidibacter sp. ROC022]MCR8725986.1 F0F1 ATP synthase subunit B [Frigidibacter sp. ROC022]
MTLFRHISYSVSAHIAALFAVMAPLAAQAEGDEVAEHAAAAGGHGGGSFFSLQNPHFIIIIAFLIFVGVLVYLKVPGKLGGMLDQRAATIRKELDEARKMREEAQAILASYERKQKDVQEQADRIISTAKAEAAAAADKAKEDLKVSIARRLASAEDQIASAQAAAVREVRNRAAEIAVEVAGEVMAKQMTAAKSNAMIDDAIAAVSSKLH